MNFCPEDVCSLRGTDGPALFQTPYLMSAEITYLWANTKRKETRSTQRILYINLNCQTQSIYYPLEKKKTCYVEKHGFDSLQHINQLFQGQDVPYVQTPVLNAFSPFYRVRDKSEWVSEEVRTPECNHNNLLNIVRYELSDTCMLNLYVLFLWA